MKIPKSILIPANLGYIRFRRSKASSVVFFAAITLTITFTIGITVGTKYLQGTILEQQQKKR
ncbi:MAG: hypothetical protein ACFFAU_20945 [Candidatus Hodarchaeota archaeon]